MNDLGLDISTSQVSVPFASVPQQKSRHRRFTLLNILGAFILLVVISLSNWGCGSASTLQQTPAGSPSQTTSTAQQTLNTFCSAVKRDDSDTVWQTYSSGYKSSKYQNNEAQWKTTQQAIENAQGGPATDCTVSDVNESGSDASGIIDTTSHDGTKYRILVKLIFEDGAWKINDVNQCC